MNAIDIGILVVVGLFAVGGLRRGFLLGLIDLVAFGLAIIVGARLAGSVAEPLAVWGVPSELAAGAGFTVVAIVSLTVIGLAARILLAPLGAVAAPLGWANSVLGLLPGAVRGIAVAALLVLLLAAFPMELGLRRSLAASRLANPIAATGKGALDFGLTWAGIEPPALGIPSLPSDSATIDLPFSGITALEIDTYTEQILLDLLNQERAIAGLGPLQADSTLADIGRQHGRDMFALGFFGHDSPITGSPTERLAAAGLDAPISGENIALAPTAEQAHEGLMNNPADRANILNPGFTRVGIAALHSADHGLIVTQEFVGA